MINASQYFYDRTGGKLNFHEVSIIMKNGAHVIASMAIVSTDACILFCPLQLVPSQWGLRAVPYDITTEEVFIPFDISAFQSTAVLSKAWKNIWAKYADETCRQIPLHAKPDHDNFFRLPIDENLVH